MPKTLKEIAALIDGEIVGDDSVIVAGASGIKEAKDGDITFVANPRYVALINETAASVIITSLEVTRALKPIIRVKDPSFAFAKVVASFYPVEVKHPKGVHSTAIIAKTAKVGQGVGIGPYVVIEDNAVIGDNTIIYSGCFIGSSTRIGSDCLIWANVSIRERVEIGNRVFIQSGAVIGSEGFGYANIDGSYKLIPQVGTVLIEDDVEIGANTTIDRARFDKTIIGRGTKIDNLVQIAHNVVIGRNSIIVAQAGISGSTHIGDNVTIAGQAGLVGHIDIGDGAVLAAQAGVMKSVAPKTMVSGYPARPHHEAMRIYAAMGRLPDLVKALNELKKKMEIVEKALSERNF
ncbi:MAG TPA: UDP-3-O-(3-hydroxymyristoyl)glucosamine N-acyltransferase [Candidatus Omnitrophica bacterium]|nr:UDP-3-O-(3-hydroxymyristoyl)glucosamine N-acyltransferase [Candidatus Omnitrophota bacterium]